MTTVWARTVLQYFVYFGCQSKLAYNRLTELMYHHILHTFVDDNLQGKKAAGVSIVNVYWLGKVIRAVHNIADKHTMSKWLKFQKKINKLHFND